MEPCIDRRACPTPWKPGYALKVDANRALLEVWAKGRDPDYWNHGEPIEAYICPGCSPRTYHLTSQRERESHGAEV